MGNKIICDNETNNTRFKNESLSRRSIRGTDLKTARTELSQTVNDPLITKEIHSMLKTFKQKHLTELFPLLNETEKQNIIDGCTNINFGMQDLIYHQILSKNLNLENTFCNAKVSQLISLSDTKTKEDYSKIENDGFWQLANENGLLNSGIVCDNK